MNAVQDTYSIDAYAADIRAIVASESNDRLITDAIKPLAKRFATSPGWFKPEYREVDPSQGFGVHLLHEEDDHRLAVFVFAWAPGKGTNPHNHKTWAVVAGIEGQEHEVNYKRLDDGSRVGFAELEQTFEETMRPGMVAACLPDDIHTVENIGEQVSVSLHTYGLHLNHTGRSEFDLTSRTERPYIVKVSEEQDG
ncbi:hypothetical protein [Tateyamaria sp. SN3-11]|uniref:cysteine dioxygenase family protein n=1 Tax=Tateyamaria sp. SN3-11 TaxID=3092147 RepID=UPI0039EC590D